MKDNVLVFIRYRAGTLVGEGFPFPMEKTKEGKNHWHYRIPKPKYAWELEKLSFTRLFFNLKQETRNKIYSYLQERLIDGSLVEDKEVLDGFFEVRLTSAYFKKEQVCPDWDDFTVNISNSTHINDLDKTLSFLGR